jgi:hypothetical protein
MLERTAKIEKYDPRIYGELKAAFLEKLDSLPHTNVETEIINQEELRQELIKDIKEGRLTVKS